MTIITCPSSRPAGRARRRITSRDRPVAVHDVANVNVCIRKRSSDTAMWLRGLSVLAVAKRGAISMEPRLTYGGRAGISHQRALSCPYLDVGKLAKIKSN